MRFTSIFFKMSGSILEIYLKDCNKWQNFPLFRYLSLKLIGNANCTFTFLLSCPAFISASFFHNSFTFVAIKIIISLC